MIGFVSSVCVVLVAWMVGRRRRLARRRALAPCARVPVREAMDRRIHTVRPSDSLGEAARWLVETGPHPLPIVDGGTTVGVLTRCDVATGIKQGGAEATVATAPHHGAITITPQDTVDEVAARLAHSPDTIAVVVDDGLPVGVVTSEHLATFVTLHGR